MNNLVKEPRRPKDLSLRDFFDIENLFRRDCASSTGRNFPAINIYEDEKSFGVDVMVPGYKKDDFKIDIEDDVLTISAGTKTGRADGIKYKLY